MASIQAARNESKRDTLRTTLRDTDLKEKVEEALERLSQLLVSHSRQQLGLNPETDIASSEADSIGRLTRFLGQVRAAWVDLPENAFPEEGAGFGSSVLVEDLDQGVRERYTLMTGSLIDIDADQVSLASPIGQALLGARAGDTVTVETPQRRRRLRVIAVLTLRDRVTDELRPPPLPAA